MRRVGWMYSGKFGCKSFLLTEDFASLIFWIYLWFEKVYIFLCHNKKLLASWKVGKNCFFWWIYLKNIFCDKNCSWCEHICLNLNFLIPKFIFNFTTSVQIQRRGNEHLASIFNCFANSSRSKHNLKPKVRSNNPGFKKQNPKFFLKIHSISGFISVHCYIFWKSKLTNQTRNLCLLARSCQFFFPNWNAKIILKKCLVAKKYPNYFLILWCSSRNK